MADATVQHVRCNTGAGSFRAAVVWGLLEEGGDVAVPGLRLADFRGAAVRFQLQPHFQSGVAHAISRESIANATIMTACLLSSSLTMVMAVFAANRGDRAWTRNWLLATMFFGAAFIVLHGMEWTKLIEEGLTLPMFPKPAHAAVGEMVDISKNTPQFPATFFGLTAMHMLHVTIGVIYLGVVAFRKWFLPVLAILWAAGYFLIPADNVFHYGIHALGLGLIVAAIILFLKPKDYDAQDVEVSGLYWHFVDLVWMFIFPLVYLLSTKIT